MQHYLSLLYIAKYLLQTDCCKGIALANPTSQFRLDGHQYVGDHSPMDTKQHWLADQLISLPQSFFFRVCTNSSPIFSLSSAQGSSPILAKFYVKLSTLSLLKIGEINDLRDVFLFQPEMSYLLTLSIIYCNYVVGDP